MDIYEALYTTRMMCRLRPDPIPLDTQARILDAAVRAPNGGNTQRWHFVAVDDPELKREFAQLFRQARALEYENFRTGMGPMVAPAPGADPAAHAETMRRIKGSGDYLADHFEEVAVGLHVLLGDRHYQPQVTANEQVLHLDRLIEAAFDLVHDAGLGPRHIKLVAQPGGFELQVVHLPEMIRLLLLAEQRNAVELRQVRRQARRRAKRRVLLGALRGSR